MSVGSGPVLSGVLSLHDKFNWIHRFNRVLIDPRRIVIDRELLVMDFALINNP
jgi:hypothetical protein